MKRGYIKAAFIDGKTFTEVSMILIYKHLSSVGLGLIVEKIS